MKSLIEATEYTKKKKKHQLIKLKKSHLEEPFEDLKLYLEGEKHLTTVSSNFNYLADWNLWHFISDFINEHKITNKYLSLSTYWAMQSSNWDLALGQISNSYKSAIPFDRSIMHLGQLLYLGWCNEAEKYGNLLLKMLYGKQYNGWIAKPLYAWFVIELFCKWQKIELDKTKLKHPDHLGIYEEALANWDTTDQQKLNDIVDKLSIFHIAQCDEDVATDEDGNEFSPEFTSSDYFIFPVEILAWLAIRKVLGLPTYNGLDELMKLKINQLPSMTIEIPQQDLVSQCKHKLIEDNPHLALDL
ncbi:hypothetical protein [Pedobacter sp. CFBP9032]|uniref:hypothetical protein n=1 Tax=Pedobacter sp. CFBP9032 TaxID=3096539 RepID=UPI002A6B16ED|nr:hypothetical protein [Pedobacter sp. CFBP9032]MDY0907085.1 hypothetical protein [Pedobacter sp. CFBP9032]